MSPRPGKTMLMVSFSGDTWTPGTAEHTSHGQVPFFTAETSPEHKGTSGPRVFLFFGTERKLKGCHSSEPRVFLAHLLTPGQIIHIKLL